nr:MAG: capsid protein [Cressdnaviricota sp.]
MALQVWQDPTSLRNRLILSTIGWAARKLGPPAWRAARRWWRGSTTVSGTSGSKLMWRRSRRYRRRPRFRRRLRFKRTYRRRSRRMRRGGTLRTESAFVRIPVRFSTMSSNMWIPITVDLMEVFPGMQDYLQAFTEVRIASMSVTLTQNAPTGTAGLVPLDTGFMLAPSAPRAKTRIQAPQTNQVTSDWVRSLMALNSEAIQQLRGVRYRFPNATARAMSFSVRPYFVEWTQNSATNPTGTGAPAWSGLIRSARRWMPISWFNPGSGTTRVQLIGPYLCPLQDTNAAGDVEFTGIMRIRYALRGQA